MCLVPYFYAMCPIFAMGNLKQYYILIFVFGIPVDIVLSDSFQIQYVKFNSDLILYDLTVFSIVYSVRINDREDSRIFSSISCSTFNYAITMILSYLIMIIFRI